jgi:hypothetical protein
MANIAQDIQRSCLDINPARVQNNVITKRFFKNLSDIEKR